MVCVVCGAERASDTAACAVCGSSPDAPTVAATSSSFDRHPARSAFPPAAASITARSRPAPSSPRATASSACSVAAAWARSTAPTISTLGQPVALKFLRGDDASARGAAAGRDADRAPGLASRMSAASTTSPNGPAGPFVSMEYIDGEDLASLLRRIGRLSPDKAVDIVRQVCAGLAAAHDRGVLHRDLKPANVMLDAPRARFASPTSAWRVLPMTTDAGEIAGTPAYMAPGAARWAASCRYRPISMPLGLLLFELLTGTPAYGSIEPGGASPARRASTPSLSPSVRATIDPRIVQVIDRCLEPDAARRPASALGSPRRCPAAIRSRPRSPPGNTGAARRRRWLPTTARSSPAAAWSLSGPVRRDAPALLAITAPTDVYSRFVPFRHSPEVLAARAREEIRQRLGYAACPADDARMGS